MTKSTITRERLEKIKSWRETYGAGSNVMLPAEEAEELAHMALAAMNSEPVAEVIQKLNGYDRPLYVVAIEGDVEEGDALYRHAQPAPEREPVKRFNADQMHRICLEATRHFDKYGAMAKEVNKLLGRIPAQPAPVVPDRWIPVSERMPEERETVVLVADERGVVWCAEIQDGEIYPDEFPGIRGFGCAEATHWMPLPAAPKQENIKP